MSFKKLSKLHFMNSYAFRLILLFIIVCSGIVISFFIIQKTQITPKQENQKSALLIPDQAKWANTLAIFDVENNTHNLYVSPAGKDTNNGSQTSPFATINKAASVATPGTTVHVLPGIYTQPVIVKNSGTANERIAFISDVKWGAKIKTTGSSDIWTTEADYIDIIGFDMTSTGASTAITNLGSYLRTISNYVHDIPGGPCDDIGGTGIDEQNYSAHDNDIIGNVVAHVGNYPTACDYTHGIYMATPRGHIYNNIVYNNVGNGIYTNHAATGTIIANNLSFANAEYGIGINTVPPQSGGGDNFIVENNIVVDNGIYGINTWKTADGIHNRYINNLFYKNKAGTYSLSHHDWNSSQQQGTIIADPQFVNYQADGSGDYHVKPTSPAIDAGISSNAPSTDFDGSPRPQGQGFDIGPYELNMVHAKSLLV